MKLAKIGDIHVSDVNPSSRKDDFTLACYNKLTFIKDYCNSNNVDYILLVGDIFHRKQPNLNSHLMVKTLIKIFSQFKGKVYCVPGNHDISQTSKNLDKQPISVLEESGVLTLLGYPFTKEFVLQTDKFDIYGMGYQEKNEKFSEVYEEMNSLIIDNNKFNILALHQMLLPDGMTFPADYLNFAEVAQLDFDMFLSGHYHPPFENAVVKKHNKLFCNSGAIMRISLDANNVVSNPQFAVFDFGDSKTPTWEVVTIPHGKVNDVFDMQKARRTIISKNEIISFTDDLKIALDSEVDISSVEGLLQIASSITQEKDVIQKLKLYLEESYEALGN